MVLVDPSGLPSRVEDPSADLMTHADSKVSLWPLSSEICVRYLFSIFDAWSFPLQITFPSPRGPSHVGCIDVMTPGRAQNSVYGRIFYPTDEDPGQNSKKWVPYLSENMYLNGLCNFMNVSGMIGFALDCITVYSFSAIFD